MKNLFESAKPIENDDLYSKFSEKEILDLLSMIQVRGGDEDGGDPIIIIPPPPTET